MREGRWGGAGAETRGADGPDERTDTHTREKGPPPRPAPPTRSSSLARPLPREQRSNGGVPRREGGAGAGRGAPRHLGGRDARRGRSPPPDLGSPAASAPGTRDARMQEGHGAQSRATEARSGPLGHRGAINPQVPSRVKQDPKKEGDVPRPGAAKPGIPWQKCSKTWIFASTSSLYMTLVKTPSGQGVTRPLEVLLLESLSLVAFSADLFAPEWSLCLVCSCLLRAHIQDMIPNLPGLVNTDGYCPLLNCWTAKTISTVLLFLKPP
ncbi:uncharacterized protein LOC141509505 isoform X2 [Macrotis lagotis]|uniref:uncharacterized protein LOC141509505 isoform X2 n=1 Tax=Macrotis lagotis TaxID=92651 RepID=UPI003D682B5B